LASDELTGRGVDTPGIKLARDYIAREFAKYGLRPGGDNGGYLQGFDVATGVAVKQPTSIAFGEQPPLGLNEDWSPLGLSGSGNTEADVVFAGYGITAKEYGYDDYAGIDVKGKIVLVLRYEPPPKDERARSETSALLESCHASCQSEQRPEPWSGRDDLGRSQPRGRRSKRAHINNEQLGEEATA
jgi:hypothetical protein